MARNQLLFKTRNKSIIKDYNRMSNMQKYRHELWKLYRDLRNKYFITNRTIDHVLYGNYEKTTIEKVDPNQLTIFNQVV